MDINKYITKITLEEKAGLELKMPDSNGINDRLIVDAVKCGKLYEGVVDEAVRRVLNIVFRFQKNRDNDAVFNRELDHSFTRKIASESFVLLKNDKILPLNKKADIAFIGTFAETPRFQGGGSSHINQYKIESALDMAKEYNSVK